MLLLCSEWWWYLLGLWCFVCDILCLLLAITAPYVLQKLDSIWEQLPLYYSNLLEVYCKNYGHHHEKETRRKHHMMDPIWKTSKLQPIKGHWTFDVVICRQSCCLFLFMVVHGLFSNSEQLNVFFFVTVQHIHWQYSECLLFLQRMVILTLVWTTCNKGKTLKCDWISMCLLSSHLESCH